MKWVLREVEDSTALAFARCPELNSIDPYLFLLAKTEYPGAGWTATLNEFRNSDNTLLDNTGGDSVPDNLFALYCAILERGYARPQEALLHLICRQKSRASLASDLRWAGLASAKKELSAPAGKFAARVGLVEMRTKICRPWTVAERWNCPVEFSAEPLLVPAHCRRAGISVALASARLGHAERLDAVHPLSVPQHLPTLTERPAVVDKRPNHSWRRLVSGAPYPTRRANRGWLPFGFRYGWRRPHARRECRG